MIQAMAVFGSIISCFRSVFLICLGRLIIGFAGSCSCLIMGKSIGETLPSSMIDLYGMLTNIFINVGFLTSFLVGLLLPTEPEEFESSEAWMVVSTMPAFFGMLTIILWSLVFTEEPVAYSITNNRNDEAKRLLNRCYSLTTVPEKTEAQKSQEADIKSEKNKIKENIKAGSVSGGTNGALERKLSIRRSSTFIEKDDVKTKNYC